MHDLVRQELRHEIGFGLVTTEAFDAVGVELDQEVDLLLNQLVPGLRQGSPNLTILRLATVVISSRRDRRTVADGLVAQISLETLRGLGDLTLDEIELVDAALAVVALLAREKEVPFLSIGQDCQGNSL